MLPSAIKSQHFTKTGKDGYKISEVDAFREEIYKSFNKIYNDNEVLNGRVSELNSLIQKYNSDKEAIASTLIYANSTAEKTLSDARRQAEEMVEEAVTKAKNEYADKVNAYENKLSELQAEYDKTKAELQKYSVSYIEKINVQAKELIENANAKAAGIVADAKVEADEIAKENGKEVTKAKKELKNIGDIISKLKSDAFDVTSKINSLTENINEEFSTQSGKFDFSDIEADVINKDEVEPFVMPDFNEILEKTSIDISSGRTDIPSSISGNGGNKNKNVSEFVTRLFESIENGSADFASYKDGLNETVARDISSKNKGDISFASRKEKNGGKSGGKK